MEELENLYNVISGEGLYTKSFDEFKTQFSDATYQDKVFKAVSEKGFYTKDINSFKQKYVGGAPKQSKALSNEVKKDDFVSSIPGLKEKLVKTQETKTSKVSVSSPKKTTATKVEEPITGFKFPEVNYR